MRAPHLPSFAFTRALLTLGQLKTAGLAHTPPRAQTGRASRSLSRSPWQEPHSRQQRGWRTDSPGAPGTNPGCCHSLTQGDQLSVRTARKHLCQEAGLGSRPRLRLGLGENRGRCCPNKSLLWRRSVRALTGAIFPRSPQSASGELCTTGTTYKAGTKCSI